MYHPTTRVLTVLELLQSHQRLSGPDLAARLQVHERTVRRYVVMLQDMGIPIEAGRGRYGAYRLRPGFKLPPLMFTEDEALALTLGLLAARRLGLAGASAGLAVEGALAKVERVMPATLRDRVQAVQETVTLAIPPPANQPAGETLMTLTTAIRQGRRVWLGYRSWAGAETERALDPYGVVYQRGRWFTVGYCHLRGDLRLFRLDRVRHVALGDETFTVPSDFDALAYVQQSLATMPARWEAEVLLQTTLEEARCLIAPDLATLDEEPDGVAVRCAVEDLDWFARVLAGLGPPFVVRHPPELRDALHRLAADLARWAADAGGRTSNV